MKKLIKLLPLILLTSFSFFEQVNAVWKYSTFEEDGFSGYMNFCPGVVYFFKTSFQLSIAISSFPNKTLGTHIVYAKIPSKRIEGTMSLEFLNDENQVIEKFEFSRDEYAENGGVLIASVGLDDRRSRDDINRSIISHFSNGEKFLIKYTLDKKSYELYYDQSLDSFNKQDFIEKIEKLKHDKECGISK